ncbi:hypothetical protein HMI54_000662 [Coelomomyces lativittatus]|nr:hypothetical protein HMI54_000662 [Coelomomyces lativittatus]
MTQLHRFLTTYQHIPQWEWVIPFPTQLQVHTKKERTAIPVVQEPGEYMVNIHSRYVGWLRIPLFVMHASRRKGGPLASASDSERTTSGHHSVMITLTNASLTSVAQTNLSDTSEIKPQQQPS